MIYQYKSAQGPIRNANEDEIDVDFNYTGRDNKKYPINYFGIYDGHGGNAVSKYIKNRLSKYFMYKSCDYKIKKKSCDTYIENSYDALQNRLKNSNVRAKNCGSTALVVLQYEKNNIYSQLKIINVGDCRAVLCDQYYRAIALTKDHKPMSFEENRRILKIDGTIVHNKDDDPRINGLSVSRAFGDIDATPHVTHEPEIFDHELNVIKSEIVDKFLILGCDGVWDVLSCQDAVDFVLFKLKELKTIEIRDGKGSNNIAYMLSKYAIDKGSQDNISVVIIFF